MSKVAIICQDALVSLYSEDNLRLWLQQRGHDLVSREQFASADVVLFLTMSTSEGRTMPLSALDEFTERQQRVVVFGTIFDQEQIRKKGPQYRELRVRVLSYYNLRNSLERRFDDPDNEALHEEAHSSAQRSLVQRQV